MVAKPIKATLWIALIVILAVAYVHKFRVDAEWRAIPKLALPIGFCSILGGGYCGARSFRVVEEGRIFLALGVLLIGLSLVVVGWLVIFVALGIW